MLQSPKAFASQKHCLGEVTYGRTEIKFYANMPSDNCNCRKQLYELILLIKSMKFLTKKINYETPLMKVEMYSPPKILVQQKKNQDIFYFQSTLYFRQTHGS